jgi:hypothetical protein
MKLISIESGRTTWLFPVEEFTPAVGVDGKSAIQTIASRYNFAHVPQNPTREEIDKNGLKFASGDFLFEGETVSIGEFIAFNDGLVSIAITTERATAFLEDLVEFLKNEFQFREPISPIKKINASTVIVEFDESVNSMLADQQAIMDIVAGHLNAPEKTSAPVELTRLEFSLDKSPSEKPGALPRLTLESRANVPLSQKRYYSAASVPTKQHLNMLQQIEAVFASRRRD